MYFIGLSWASVKRGSVTLTAPPIIRREEESGQTLGKPTFTRQMEPENLGKVAGKKGGCVLQGRAGASLTVGLGTNRTTGNCRWKARPGRTGQVAGSWVLDQGTWNVWAASLSPQSLLTPHFPLLAWSSSPAHGAGPRSSTHGTTQWFLAPKRNLFPGRSSQNRSAPLLASVVQSEPTFSNRAEEEQLKMDSGRVSAEEQLKERESIPWSGRPMAGKRMGLSL